MNHPTVTALYERDLDVMEGMCGHPYVLVHPGIIVEVTFPLHDHEAALAALDRAVADVRRQIEETR